MTAFDLIGYALLFGLGAIVVGAIVNKNFRDGLLQLLRIRSASAVKNGSSAVERNEDRLSQLLNKLPEQRKHVSSVMSLADKAQRNLNNKIAERDRLFAEYQRDKGLNASAETLSSISAEWKSAKDAVPALEQLLQEAHDNAAGAQRDLDDIISQLKSMESKIQDQSGKAELAAAFRESAQTRQTLSDMKKGMGDMAKDFDETDKELDDARNLNDLSKGSATDRERQDLEHKAQTQGSVDEIEQAINQQKK